MYHPVDIFGSKIEAAGCGYSSCNPPPAPGSNRRMPPPALCIILGIVHIISECGGGGQSQVTRPQARSRSRSGEGRVAVTCTGPHWWVWAEMSCKSPQSKLFAAYNLVFNLHFKRGINFSGRLPLNSFDILELLWVPPKTLYSPHLRSAEPWKP